MNFTKEQLEQYKENIVNKDGVLYWKSNNHIVPLDISMAIKNSGEHVDLEKRDKMVQQELDQLRESMKNYTPSHEEIVEMQATFGKGTTVVNVLTGEKIKL